MGIDLQSTGEFGRSPESRAFEDYWRSLRGEALMPARADFHPATAVRFLRDIVLLEATCDGTRNLRIRVAGEGYTELVGRNVSGLNHLDFVPEWLHADAIESARLMMQTPCGLWQISPAHLSRGYTRLLEITALPLAPADGVTPFILCHVRKIEGLLPATLPIQQDVIIDTAVQFEFLDVGAGAPKWVSVATKPPAEMDHV